MPGRAVVAAGPQDMPPHRVSAAGRDVDIDGTGVVPSGERDAVMLDRLQPRRSKVRYPNKHVTWIIVAFVTLTVGHAQATTIVIYRSGTEIIVVADSKTRGIVSQTCKLRVYDGLVAAATGSIMTGNDAAFFSFYDLASRWLRGRAAPTDRVSALGREAGSAFGRLVDAHSRREQIPDWPSLDYVIAFIGDNTPTVVFHRYVTQFSLGTNDSVNYDVTDLTGTCERGCQQRWFFFGVTEALDPLVASGELARLEQRLGPADAAVELVRRQIQATPAVVGPPVDVLRLTASGIEWLARKDECQARED